MCNCVAIVSSSDISREGLAHFVRSEGFDVFASIRSIDAMPATEEPFLAVIDEPNPILQAHAVEELKALAPASLPVILAERFDMESMIACFQAGAQGYIVKSIRSEPLMTALKLASLGEKVMPSDLVDMLDMRPSAAPVPMATGSDLGSTNLSPRERDVLCCLMAGYPNKTIARQLYVCEATVKVHVKAILRKLKVSNRTQAAIWASSNGITDPTIAYLA